MNKIFIISLLLAFCFLPTAYAQEDDEDIFVPWDTIISLDGFNLKLERIDHLKYGKLYNKHGAQMQPSEPVCDFEAVVKLLSPEYRFEYTALKYTEDNVEQTHYNIRSFERRGVYKIVFSSFDGFGCYYPKEKIITYYPFGGDAFFIETGENAYDPGISAIQKEGKFRLACLYDGQDGTSANWEKWNSNSERFDVCISFSDLLNKLGHYYFHKPFWVGDTLYFRLGFFQGDTTPEKAYKHMSVKIME